VGGILVDGWPLVRSLLKLLEDPSEACVGLAPVSGSPLCSRLRLAPMRLSVGGPMDVVPEGISRLALVRRRRHGGHKSPRWLSTP